MLILIYQAELCANVETRSRFGCRATGDTIESGFVSRGELSRTFSDIQDDGRSRTVELVCEICPTLGQVLDDVACSHQEVERDAIDIEPFMIE